jgi:hypothetical protein
MLPKASALLLLFGTGEVDKHPTTRITDNLLSAVRACSNSGIENVPSVCASETPQEGAPSAALGRQKPGCSISGSGLRMIKDAITNIARNRGFPNYLAWIIQDFTGFND